LRHELQVENEKSASQHELATTCSKKIESASTRSASGNFFPQHELQVKIAKNVCPPRHELQVENPPRLDTNCK